MVEVIDQFLEPHELEKIQDVLLGEEFPWFFNYHVLGNADHNILHFEKIYQFTHIFYANWEWNSQYKDVISPVLNKLPILSPLRMKANLTCRADDNYLTGQHFDIQDNSNKVINCKIALFYLNSTNGPTVFENGDKIECIENRLVLFDNHQRHSGVMATDVNNRVVINMDFLPR